MDKSRTDILMALEALEQAKALKSPRTLEWYRSNVAALRQWLVANRHSTRLNDLTAEVVQSFLAAEANRRYKTVYRSQSDPTTGLLKSRPITYPGRLSEHSLNSKIRCLRAFGRWLVKTKWLIESPFEDLELASAPKLRKKVLSEDEINYLFSLLNDKTDIGARNKAILWLFLDTGIRLSELATIGLHNLNVTDDDDGPWIQVLGKDRKERRIGLTSGARQAVKHYVEFFRPTWQPLSPLRVAEVEARGVPFVVEPLFLTVQVSGLDRPAGEQLLPNAVQLIVSRLAKRAGIRDLSCHAFRRTFATQNLELGASPLDIMRDLGHSSLTMTNYYASLADQNRMRRHRQFSYMERITRASARGDKDPAKASAVTRGASSRLR